MSYQIDSSVDKKSSWRGNLYAVRYKVQASDKNLFDQYAIYNSNAQNLPGNPINVASYIYESSCNYVSPHWMYTFRACDAAYQWEQTYIPQNINTIIKEYSIATFTITERMYGVHRASMGMAGYSMLNGVLTKGSAQLQNISGTACSFGDWVYDNATLTSAGSQQNKSPFTTLPTFTSTIGDFIDVPLHCTVYSVTFTGTVNSEWRGISGSWGSGCVPNDTGTGLWIAVNQTCTTFKQGGAQRWRVKRTAQKAPKIYGTQLYWYPYEGTWSW